MLLRQLFLRSRRCFSSALFPEKSSNESPLFELYLNFTEKELHQIFDSAARRHLTLTLTPELCAAQLNTLRLLAKEISAGNGKHMDQFRSVECESIAELLHLPNTLSDLVPKQTVISNKGLSVELSGDCSANDKVSVIGGSRGYRWGLGALLEERLCDMLHRELRSASFDLISPMDIFRAPVVEACGAQLDGGSSAWYVPVCLEKLPGAAHHRSELRAYADTVQSWLYLCGVSPYMYASLQARTLQATNKLLSFYAISSQFKSAQCGAKLLQSLVAGCGVWARTGDEALSQFWRLLQLSCSLLEQLRLPYRTVTMAATQLPLASQLSVGIDVYMPHARHFRRVGCVHLFGDYLSRRLMIRRKPGFVDYLHLTYADVADVDALVDAVQEHLGCAASGYTIPWPLCYDYRSRWPTFV